MTSSRGSDPIRSFGPSSAYDASVPTVEGAEEPEEELDGEEVHGKPQSCFWRRSKESRER
jgi:hypothetical protein